MKLKEISREKTHLLCKNERLILEIGAFNFAISSPLRDVSDNVYKVYQDFNLLNADSLIDFDVRVDKPRGIRRWFKPQVFFYLDGRSPFLPLPATQAFPLLEWGMNWCIGQHAHQYLMIHAAVLEKDGTSVILPAESGSGKSTLTAILSTNDWRLLSDEMALIDTTTYQLAPVARPISLKNQSINVAQALAPNGVFSDIIDDTNKGTICHLKADERSVNQLRQHVAPANIVFPKYVAQSEVQIESKARATAFMDVIENSFNYHLLGETGFNTLSKVMHQVDCYNFQYSKIEDALTFFNGLVK